MYISYLEKEICPEKWLGLKWPGLKSAPYRYNTWIRENCSYEKPVEDLVTVLVNSLGMEEKDIMRLAQSHKESYPKVKLIMGMDSIPEVSIEGVEMVKVENNVWKELLETSETKYVLLGFDLQYITTWINLHRGIRMLGQGSLAVGGAVRNSTGHWRAPCYQVALR